jgi:hypothetical protein
VTGPLSPCSARSIIAVTANRPLVVNRIFAPDQNQYFGLTIISWVFATIPDNFHQVYKALLFQSTILPEQFGMDFAADPLHLFLLSMLL